MPCTFVVFRGTQTALEERRKLSRHPSVTRLIRQVCVAVAIAASVRMCWKPVFLSNKCSVSRLQHWLLLTSHKLEEKHNITFGDYAAYFKACAKVLMPDCDVSVDQLQVWSASLRSWCQLDGTSVHVIP